VGEIILGAWVLYILGKEVYKDLKLSSINGKGVNCSIEVDRSGFKETKKPDNMVLKDQTK